MVRLFREDGGRLVEIKAELIDGMKEKEIERLIMSHPQVLGENLLFIGEQSDFPAVGGDAIDILALDKEANLVIIELKRGTTPSDSDFQLLKYAGYVHRLTAESFSPRIGEFLNRAENRWYREKLEKEFDLDLSGEIDPIELVYLYFEKKYKYEDYESRFNNKQRIVLVAEKFDMRISSVLVWLHRQGIGVSGYIYGRFRSGDVEHYFFDRVIPSPDIESELASITLPHTEKPWQRDGRQWHHNLDETWPENVELLDALMMKLEPIPDIEILWGQKLYVKIFGVSKRELRVYPSFKKGRIDLLFMHADASQTRRLLDKHGVKLPVQPSYTYDEGTSWIGISSEEELDDSVISSVVEWLSKSESPS